MYTFYGKRHRSIQQIRPDRQHGGFVKSSQLIACQIKIAQLTKTRQSLMTNDLEVVGTEIKSSDIACMGEGVVTQNGQLVAV
jgi:hypothetical protein